VVDVYPGSAEEGGARGLDWGEIAAAAAADAEGRESGTAQALLYIAARISEERLGDPFAAVELLDAAVARGAGAPLTPVLRALRDLALEAGSILAAIDALEQEVAASGATARRADLLVEKASLYADHLLVSAPARAAVEDALRLAAGHRGALGVGQGLAERAQDATWLRLMLEQRLAAASKPSDRARALVRLAMVTETDPAQLATAIGYLGRALDEDGGGDAAPVARAALIRLAARTEQDVELLRGLIAEAEALGAGPVRAAWLATAASVNRYRLGAIERATTTIELGLLDEPSDLALLATAAEDHLVAGRWRRGIELLDRQADLVVDPDYAAVLQAHAAHIAESQLNDDEGAARRLRRVLAVRPSDPVALSSMERIASRSGDVPLQIELQSASVGRAEDPGERAALAVRAAELNELGLADLDTAAAFARRALDAIPGYGPALHTLDGLYARLGRWNDMLRVIDASSANEAAMDEGGGRADEATARRLERIGAVTESGLADPGRALEIYRQWVELGVRRSAALMALLRAAEKAGDSLVAGEAAMKIGMDIPELSDAQRVAWRFRAATLYEERAVADAEAIAAFEAVLELAPRFRPAFAGLARAHRRMRNWPALADVLSRRSTCEASVSRAAALEVEAAQIHAERLQAPDAALAALDRALTFEPGSLSALDFRWRLLHRLGRAEEAAAALGALAERLGDPAARAAMLRRQAEILEWKLRRPREALVAIERALGTSRYPGMATAELAQERLFDRLGRHGDAAALQLGRLSTPIWRAADAPHAASGRRLDLATRLGDQEEGLRVAGQVVAVAPADLFALELQVWLGHRVGDDAVVASASERIGELHDDTAIRVASWRASIGARARMGAEPAACFALYQRSAEADPSSDVVATYERLATRRGDWARARPARQALVDAAPDDRARAVRLWELAAAEIETGDRARAIEVLERVRELAPDLTVVGWMLAQLLDGAGEPLRAAEAFVTFGRETRVRDRATAVLRKAARLYAEVLRDDEAAARALEHLLGIDPDADVDFQVLEVILKQRGELDRLIEVARTRAGQGAAGARRDRLLHLAGLLRDRRAAEAVEPLQAAVTLDPHFIPALVALGELFADLGRTAEAVMTFRRVAAVAPDARGVAAAWLRVGQIGAGALGDPILSVAAYRSALAAVPDDVAALSGVTQGLLRQRNYQGAAEALQRLAAVDPDVTARVGHYISLGEILTGPVRDLEGAADALEKALELDPARSVTIDRLDAVLTDIDDPRRLARALSRHLEAAPDNVARRLRLGRLLRGPLGSADRAAQELRLVVEQSPGDVAVRAELAAVLEEAERVPDSISEHLVLLRGEPLRVESLRALRRLFGRAGDRLRLEVVIAILTALGLADAEDQRAAREARLRWSEEPRGALGGSDFEDLVRHPAERHPATALLATLTEVVPRLHPINLEEWGVTRADRVGPRADDPVRALVQRLATLFGIEETFDVYLARAGVNQVEIEATFPASLLVPATLLPSMPRRESMLQLARAMARLRAGSYLATRLSARELGVVLAGSLRSRYSDYGRGLGSEEALVDMEQKVARWLPRRHRRAFDRAVVGVAEAGPLDVSRWRQAMIHTAHRASVVATGDVLGCLEQIVRSERRLAAVASNPTELVEVARNTPELVELVSFVLGDEYVMLRNQVA
jgi:tetratricopeptide (TPR) repeat protein